MPSDVRKNIYVGQKESIKVIISSELINTFAEFSSDRNPLHMDQATAELYGHPKRVAHGVITLAFLSNLIGMKLPGPGALWISHTIEWLSPVYAGDEIEITGEVARISTSTGILILSVVSKKIDGTTVMKGECKIKMSDVIEKKNMSKFPLKKRALILGGSRGIGAEISRKLCRNGFDVLINCRPGSSAGALLVEELRSDGYKAVLSPADLSDPVSIKEMLQSIGNDIDILIFCATPQIEIIDADKTTYEKIESYIKTYLLAPTMLIPHISDFMKQNHFGRVVFLGTSSLYGIPPNGFCSYITAKSAVWGYVRCLATEFGPYGVTVNMISPSLTLTDLTTYASVRTKELEARKSPVRRLARTQDTAALVQFLIEDDAGYINGSCIPVTGGPI